jgi:hypothetical protein
MRGERWKKFFNDRGWIKNDVISGGEGEVLKIAIRESAVSEGRKPVIIESALILDDYDILCYESPSGSVFFQWNDILQVKLETEKQKRGWL